jgi:hypothetical protein
VKKKRSGKKPSAKITKRPVVRAPSNKPTQKEHKPERITAWANGLAAIAGAVTAVLVSVKTAIEVGATLKTEAPLKAEAVPAARVVPWRKLLCILISLAISLLNAPNELMPWREIESLAFVIQLALA